MGRFVVHGVLIEEPRKATTSSGMDTITLLVEEKVRNAFGKEMVNVYSVDFVGKAVNCVPDNVRMIGCPVVITGTIRSREYKGKYYNDLSADSLTIIASGKPFVADFPVPAQAEAEESDNDAIVSSNLDALDTGDDDLPF